MADNINGIEKYLGDSQLWDMPKKKLKFKINDGAILWDHLSDQVKTSILTGKNPEDEDFPWTVVYNGLDYNGDDDPNYERTALHADQGKYLYELIQNLANQINSISPTITLTGDESNVLPVPASGHTGNECLYYYFTAEGAVGDIEAYITNEYGQHAQCSIERYDNVLGTASGRITVKLNSTKNTHPQDYVLVVRSVVNNVENARAENIIRQEAYVRQVQSMVYVPNSASLRYDVFTKDGGYVYPTFTGLVNVTYDTGEVKTNVPFVLNDSFVKTTVWNSDLIDGVTMGSAGIVYAPSTSESTLHTLGTVSLVCRIFDNNPENIFNVSAVVYQAGVNDGVVKVDPMYIAEFGYPENFPATINGSKSITPSVIIKQRVYYVSGISTDETVDLSTINATFSISPTTGITIDSNTGKITKTSSNQSGSTLSYRITMAIPDNVNITEHSRTIIVTQPSESVPVPEYGDVTVTFTYPKYANNSALTYNFDYDGYATASSKDSAPKITKVTQKYGSSTATIYTNTANDTLQQSISKAGLSNVRFSIDSGATIDPLTGVVTGSANLGGSKTFTVTMTGSLNGVSLKNCTTTLQQDTVNRYIWFGYSETTPTAFGNWTHGEQKEASKVYSGAEQAIVDTSNIPNIKCHWIMIPKDSNYHLSEVRDFINTDIKAEGIGEEILPTANNAIKDGNHRAYYMWHKTTNRNITASSKFVIG